MSAAPGQPARVLVLWPADPGDELLKPLRAFAPGVDVRHSYYEEPGEIRTAKRRGLAYDDPPLADELQAELSAAEVLLGLDLPTRIATLAPRLRWIQMATAGIDQLRGVEIPVDVLVTDARGARDGGIAEFVLARLLGIWKHLDVFVEAQRAHSWTRHLGRSFAGSTMVVVGVGSIGGAIAARAHTLGVRVLGVRRSGEPHPACERVVNPERLDDVLGEADMVVVAVPSTPETRDLFDAGRFAAMKAGATFCNIARGALVDEDTLVDALRTGHLGAAALDVVRDEPLPAASPLWDVENLYLSAHSSSVADGGRNVFELFADNLGRYLAGTPLRNIVDPVAGY